MSKRPISEVLAHVLERRRLADAPHLADVVLGRAVGHGVVRGVGDAQREPVALRLGLRELGLERLQLGLHALQLLELLRGGLAVELLARAELVDLGHEGAPALVGGEQRVERARRALARERGAERVGIGARCPEVDHAVESRYASSTCATPSSSSDGHTRSATASTRSCAFATATP